MYENETADGRDERSGRHLVTRDLIVIGASAGGVEALQEVVRGLPGDLRAAVLIVTHVPAEHRSVMPRLLSHRGPLPARHARDHEPIVAGELYVAPPGRHLVVMDSEMRLVRGATENHHRPAIDPLFRSAALAFGPRVIGVVLSGTLDDGTAGLGAIKQAGGTTVVQDPRDAAFPSMPESAVRNVDVDYVAPARELGPLLARLTAEEVMTVSSEQPQRESELMPGEPRKLGTTLGRYSCPDCGGVLTEMDDDGLLHFRCRIGHAYSPETLVSSQANTVEGALWMAIRAMEENAEVCRRLAARSEARRQPSIVARYEERANDMLSAADTVRALILDGPDIHSREQSAGNDAS